MPSEDVSEKLGLNFSLQRPTTSDLKQIPVTRDHDGKVIYPEVDADGDHVHFEMVPMEGESLLWLTMRRGTTPEVASAALRKIADLIDRHGQRLLILRMLALLQMPNWRKRQNHDKSGPRPFARTLRANCAAIKLY